MPAAHESFVLSWDDERGLTRVEWAPGTVCGIDEARAVDHAIEALGRGPVRCVVNLRGIDSVDRPAREHFIHSPHYVAVALIANSAPTRMLANFFLSLNRSATPARMFATEADALVWLDSQP